VSQPFRFGTGFDRQFRHRQVHDRHIGLGFFGEFDGAKAGARLPTTAMRGSSSRIRRNPWRAGHDRRPESRGFFQMGLLSVESPFGGRLHRRPFERDRTRTAVPGRGRWRLSLPIDAGVLAHTHQAHALVGPDPAAVGSKPAPRSRISHKARSALSAAPKPVGGMTCHVGRPS
jgi:hypothetical protein